MSRSQRSVFFFLFVSILISLSPAAFSQSQATVKGSIVVVQRVHQQHSRDYCQTWAMGIHGDPVGEGNPLKYVHEVMSNGETALFHIDRTEFPWTGYTNIPGQQIAVRFNLGFPSENYLIPYDESGCRASVKSEIEAYMADFELFAHYAGLPNAVPVASFTFEPSGTLYGIRFDASASADSDGTVEGYRWKFGTEGESNEGPVTEFVFPGRGEYRVELVVVDDDGDESSVFSQTVFVNGPGVWFIVETEKLDFPRKTGADAEVTVGDSVLVRIRASNNGDYPLEDVHLPGGEAAIEIRNPGGDSDALVFGRAITAQIFRLDPNSEATLEYVFAAKRRTDNLIVSVAELQGYAILESGERLALTEEATRCAVAKSAAMHNESDGCARVVINAAPLVVNSTRDLPLAGDAEDGCRTGETIVRDGRDEAECTLRAALHVASGSQSGETVEIRFNIPGGAAAHRIALSGEAFAPVKGAIRLSGNSQPGGGRIDIDGTALSGNDPGFVFEGNAHIEQLSFFAFPGAALELRGNASRIISSRFGTNWAGDHTSTDISVSDALRNGGAAIVVKGNNVWVGGPGSEGNLIVGSHFGVFVDGALSTRIIGNEIGSATAPMRLDGIRLKNAYNTTIGSSIGGNVIRFSLSHGIIADEQSREITIQNNEIRFSKGDGIRIAQESNSSGWMIGGEDDGDGNVIDQNEGAGIRVTGPSLGDAAAPVNIQISGNTVRKNEDGGVVVQGGSGILIGGETSRFGHAPGNTIVDGIVLNPGYGVRIHGNSIAALHHIRNVSSGLAAVHIKGSANSVGGVSESLGNSIYGVPDPDPNTGGNEDSGSQAYGFGVYDEGTNSRITNNWIGVDGALYVGVELRGIHAELMQNVISGNEDAGVVVRNPARIEGNRIGTSTTGNGGRGNGGPGVEVWAATAIGGVVSGEHCVAPCNVISANAGPGILIRKEAAGTIIQGNRIGVGLDGLTVLGNGESGIVALADQVKIGGDNDVELFSCKGACNIIAGNEGDGIRNFEVEFYDNLTSGDGYRSRAMGETGANGFVIRGNFIGTGLPGGGNKGHGIALGGKGSDHIVGDITGAGGNLITGNGGAGVLVGASTASVSLRENAWVGGQKNAIRGNLISHNGGGAIDLYANYMLPGGDGWNELHTEDRSYGPNQLISWPYLLESRILDAGRADLLVFWSGSPEAAARSFSLDVYAASGCEGARGAAENFIITRNVQFNTEGSGWDTVRVEIPLLASMPYFAATLTDSEGNTSEMSNCRPAGKTLSKASTKLEPGLRKTVNSILLTRNLAVQKNANSSDDVIVFRSNAETGNDAFEETTAFSADGIPIQPAVRTSDVWDLAGLMNVPLQVCLPIENAHEVVVLGRGAATSGFWRPFDTAISEVDGVRYACADVTGVTGFATGSGSVPAVAAPSLVYPVTGASHITVGVVFEWREAFGASSYEIQIAMDPQFQHVIVHESDLTGTSRRFEGLLYNQTHYWRVRAKGPQGTGAWSVAHTFTTVANSVNLESDDDLPGTWILESNYPNPFNPHTHIRFQMPENGNIRLEVRDILGRRVAVLAEEYVTAGTHTRVFDAGKLASGVYIYVLYTPGGKILSRQMTLLK